jgi:hypothetical protein
MSPAVTAIRCHTLHDVTPIGPEFGSPVTTPILVSGPISRSQTLTSDEFRSPMMSFTNRSLHVSPAMALQTISTEQPTSPGTTPN